MGDHHKQESEGQQRIGKGMVIGAWVLLLIMLTLFFQSYIEQQNNPNRDPVTGIGDGGVKEVILERNRAGHYVANGKINGQAVTFLLDTGATNVAVSASLAKRLGLRPGASTISHTAAGQVISLQTRLDTVSLGRIELEDVRASILPSMQGDGVLLGMSFLQKLELLQRGRHLILRQY